ncbi:heavy metal translocating P-type ATPase [Roseofilum casamattae]|uniref:Heavy metal translocating P-type ATPase n=1 Tax=Roseofilum casamattae BLCC-M143 TaxID=3022442 RepID=A0ABT7BTI1_9CYAN|nr:heavy metal translocating P-type ATPase [Roseofilum casamattae]MDJ1182493.1 heavy metal translocating P-type ATPase [Roseofilum casamattae BLCC-M143]
MISPAAIPVKIVTLDVSGMKCAGCVQAVERQLLQQVGVQSASVNLITAVAAVEYDPDRASGDDLAAILTRSGFPSQPRSPERSIGPSASVQQRYQQELRGNLNQLAIASTLIILSFTGHWFHSLPLISTMAFHWTLATLTLLFPGRKIILEGARGLWQNTPNMNSLIGLGATAAYTTSCIALLFPQTGWECFFDEPVMLLGFILLGRTLETRARSRAAADLSALLSLQPKRAHLVPSGSESDAPSVDIGVETVKVGEWVRVLPGELFPVDGEVVVGETTVNESTITGEATPVAKQSGDRVTAGTINLSGTVIAIATRVGEATTLGQIVQWVEVAQTKKAPIQHVADAIAGYFTYAIIALSSLTFLFWSTLGVHLWPDVLLSAPGDMEYSPLLLSLKLAIATLVVACPCALGLATPTAILVGTGIGAKQGILIKGGEALEQLHGVKTIVFDKTGTLTEGEPRVTDCLPNEELGWTRDRLLAYAASVERGTNHPLARAIVNAAAEQQLDLPAAGEFQTFPGLGTQALVEEQLVLLGTPEWLSERGIVLPRDRSSLDTLVDAGKTVISAGINGQWAGWIAIVDPLRREAQTTLSKLENMGLRVKILTGDRPEVANKVAQTLGLQPTDVIAGVKPDGKARAIANFQHPAPDIIHKVAMVGEGINDAPALAQADVGIALQSATEVASETAQLILLGDRLADIPQAIALSRATFGKIRQNLFWAFAYNLLAIPLAAGLFLPHFGLLLSPAIAGACMAFSSVTVVTNSLFLRDNDAPSQAL